MGRAPCCDKANVKKGPWSPEEDAKLKAYIEEHGTGGNWIALPQKIGLKRCGKSCRLRWLNYLRPNIKHGSFSEEEDQIICSLYISIGSRWSIIAAQLPGRTDNDIKNYWNTKLKKKLLGKCKESSQSQSHRLAVLNKEALDEANVMNHESPAQSLSASALERMQLHMQLQGIYNPLSFYNNTMLWPKYNSAQDIANFQDHPSLNSAAQQEANNETTVQTATDSVFTMKPMLQEDHVDHGSSLGFHSPSSTSALSMDNSNYSSLSGLQSELQGMLYNKNAIANATFRLQEENQLPDLDCYHEICGEKENVNWLPSNNGYDQPKLSVCWESASALQYSTSMIQDYAIQYDL